MVGVGGRGGGGEGGGARVMMPLTNSSGSMSSAVIQPLPTSLPAADTPS